MKFESCAAKLLYDFVAFRKASGRWYNGADNSLRAFDRYCKEKYPLSTSLSQEIVDGWFLKRHSETNNSCISRCSSVRVFLKFLQDRGLTDIQIPPLPKSSPSTFIPHIFLDDEIKRFFEVCDNLPSEGRPAILIRRITVPVFFRLLYSSGIRTTEARLLKKTDVDLNHGVLSIHNSKGPDQHYVVLHDSMTDLMRRYDKAIQKWFPQRTYFFPSHGDVPYTSQWVVWNFRQIWNKVSPSDHATAYAFRHHYATKNIKQWIGEGFAFDDKLIYLSKSMGHRTLNSTTYYYSIVPVLSQILLDKTEDGFNELLPEVNDEHK